MQSMNSQEDEQSVREWSVRRYTACQRIHRESLVSWRMHNQRMDSVRGYTVKDAQSVRNTIRECSQRRLSQRLLSELLGHLIKKGSALSPGLAVPLAGPAGIY